MKLQEFLGKIIYRQRVCVESFIAPQMKIQVLKLFSKESICEGGREEKEDDRLAYTPY